MYTNKLNEMYTNYPALFLSFTPIILLLKNNTKHFGSYLATFITMDNTKLNHSGLTTLRIQIAKRKFCQQFLSL